MRFPVLALAVVACNPPVPPEGVDLGGPYDFGTVQSGQSAMREVVLTNTAELTLGLASVEVDDPAFVIDPVGSEPIVRGASVRFQVTFTAQTALLTRHAATLTVRTLRGTVATATLTAVAVFQVCVEENDSVDFLGVRVGETARSQLRVLNRSGAPRLVTLGALYAYGAASFNVVAPPPTTVLPGQELTAGVTFSPDGAREFFARVQVSVEGCQPSSVALHGEGMNRLMECEGGAPYVLPGGVVEGQVVIRNFSANELEVSQLEVMPMPEFTLGDAGTVVLVPPGRRSSPGGPVAAGGRVVPLVFRPAVLGLRTGTFNATTSLAREPRVTCTIDGTGGGPDIDVDAAIELPADGGVVNLQVRNVAPAQDFIGWLRLQDFDAGSPGLSVTLPPPLPIPAGASVSVLLSAAAPGNWSLTLYCNDVDEREVTVTVSARN